MSTVPSSAAEDADRVRVADVQHATFDSGDRRAALHLVCGNLDAVRIAAGEQDEILRLHGGGEPSASRDRALGRACDKCYARSSHAVYRFWPCRKETAQVSCVSYMASDLSTTAPRAFREIAQAGSFSAAALSLGYTQSAISRQIAALEAAVSACPTVAARA